MAVPSTPLGTARLVLRSEYATSQSGKSWTYRYEAPCDRGLAMGLFSLRNAMRQSCVPEFRVFSVRTPIPPLIFASAPHVRQPRGTVK